MNNRLRDRRSNRLAAAMALALLARPAFAQQLTAPPLQLSLQTGRLSAALRIHVREFRFEGNTVFTSAELSRLVEPYTGRDISSEELEEARRLVTLYYVNHGYINSGALIPEQDTGDGIITIRIVEGVLSSVRVSGNRWLRESFIEGKLRRWRDTPVNMDRLREGLQLLRQDPNVSQVNAELKPGVLPGQSLLDVRVQDQNPFRVGIQVDNDRPASVGADEVLFLAGDRNLTGHGDPLDITYGIAEGGNHGFKFSDFNNESGSYRIPLTAYDTTLRVYGSKNDFAIVEEPVSQTNVRSESYSAGATLRQPFYQTANRELALAVTFERRYSKSTVSGLPFTGMPGAPDGVNEVSALRVAQEWVDRNLNQVVALRSTFSVGLDAFGITDEDPDRNGKFFSWLGQAQYVRRLFDTPNQIVIHADGQWSPHPLLSLEQFTLGGPDTVRGYRVNQVVSDEGVDSSAELRLPVVFNARGDAMLQFAPFIDFGNAWNVDNSPMHPATIWSAGVGLLFTPNKHVNAQIYWGHPFREVATPNTDLQDLGLYFKLNVEGF